MGVKIIGGKKLQSTLRSLKSTKARALSVGFYPNHRYDDGMPVAQVAFWNEYGTIKIPERPFFRHANFMAIKKFKRIVKNINVSKNKSVITVSQVNQIGRMWTNTLQQSIDGEGISYVPNAPSTIARKGSSQPLIDTSLMLASPDYKVIR